MVALSATIYLAFAFAAALRPGSGLALGLTLGAAGSFLQGCELFLLTPVALHESLLAQQ